MKIMDVRTDKNDAFGMYRSPNCDRRCLCMGFQHMDNVGHTRLVINGLIGKSIINCYNQLLSINNNDGPTVNFWLGSKVLKFAIIWIFVE